VISRRRRILSGLTAFTNITVFDGARFIEHVTVVVRDGMIASMAPAAAGEPPDEALPVKGTGRTLLPGSIDCHVHLGLHNPRRVLRHGVTTARDLGWPLEQVRALAAVETGPRLLYAGPMLTAPGGYPVRAGWAAPGTAREVSSADDARAAVRDLVSAGASVVKVAQDPRGPTLDVAELRAIVEEARAAGLGVTTHVGSLEQLERALDAGIGELAHGLWSDERIPDATIERLVVAGVTVVPTLHIDPSPARVANTRRFVEAGATVVYGTDMGNPPAPGGIDADELRLMGEVGMPPDAALAAATARAAEHLGLADRGRISPGLLADLIMVKGDPREDLAILAKPLLVMRGGRAIR